MTKRKTTEQFIQQAKTIHGNKYDYSLVEYKDINAKIKIICSKYGIFEQLAGAHINSKAGCSKCSDNYNPTTEEFIKKAQAIHGDRYDYSLVEYINNKTKVKIICFEHGIFEQRPDAHIGKKCGCFICSNLSKSINYLSTIKEFTEKAKIVHGDKYDYSLVNYKGSKIKVKIICPEHGIFEQTPNSHLLGHGCARCKFDQYILTTEKFIEKAKAIHGDKYDYSLINYIDSKTKVKIICPEHGIFKQQPNGHLSGQSCPNCYSSKGENFIINYLNKNNIIFKQHYKFNNCKNKKPLPFDFYIENKNILIEYDGKQHYKSVEFFGGEKAFKSLKIRDEIKTKYCKDNNIQLIRIKYNENIEEKLNKLLF